MVITSIDINDLILFGRTNSNPDTGLMAKFRQKDYINRQHGDTWRKLVADVSDDDLIYIFKGLVILERELKWIGGSVAGAIWVYDVIRQRNIDLDYKVADFGLQNCDNPWVPFGNSYYGKRAITDYLSFRDDKVKSSIEKAGHYAKVLKRVNGRKIKRATAIAELRKLSSDERRQIRSALLSKYASSTINERLEIIAADQRYPPEYYPIEWIKLTMGEIQKLPLELVKKLYDKLSTKTKGEWKRFAHELEKMDNGI